ncbi:Z1 domain-containing protein [Bradyrhizobium tropiciagri]|uniref:Z1 domain-containing protein n=1 Tax=Bradyrhizobium tropiciagri TaxID=312253 RepID=UPI001BA89E8D|nr:Z1 domain-containing protein [Bradyrhizobium tropiciagri]MBR0899580.1 Z1 domain-containing protein [Bradyrhizobium tropiciagri]
MAKQAGFDVLVATLIGVFSEGRDTAPTIDEIASRARELAPLVGFVGDIADAVDEALLSIEIRMGIGHSLVDAAADHDPDWINKREIDWSYTQNYSRFLREEGWNPTVVTSLEIVTERIVSLLQDPLGGGSWDRRGLVIGHVQSGKTANYLGLVARAADAGYRFIVIVAGIHNNLRRQTQERVDSGFVGWTSDPQNRVRTGVGKFPGHQRPVVLTNILSDFTKQNAQQLQAGLADWSKPVVVVIKKNVSTLSQIHSWLKDFNLQTGESQIAGAPMLFIDDEADNASVNTSKPDLDPTKTNGLIREILALFRKSCYVGYTATPFANIFINPAAYDERTREDLFPRDFIYCLDAPNNYFGAEKIFLDEAGEAKFIRKIDDAEDILPLRHKKDIALSDLPASLKRAIQVFILTRAIRNLRGQAHKHCSMLVNVSRFVDVQKNVRVLVHSYLEALKNAIRSNYALPSSVSLKNRYLASLKEQFDAEHFNGPESWEEVRAQLDEAVGSVKTLVVNSSKSDEPLDYAAYAAKGEALNVIAVGGLSLSRGLTIEGLTVSYMYRNTKMYDTLMQMGRWFGYRPGYEDICRVFLSEESSGWYSHIAVATEELRDRVKEMRRFNKTPKDFGLLVQSHPDALLVTAANKMQFAEKRTVKVSFDGMLRETFVLSSDPIVNEENRDLFVSLFDELSARFSDRRVRDGDREECPIWRGVASSKVEEFFRRFRYHPHHDGMRTMLQSYLARIGERFPTWDVAFMTLGTARGKPVMIGDFPMVAQMRSAGLDERGNLIRSDAGPGYWISSKQRVAGARDERVGLSADELVRADSLAKERGKAAAADLDFRNASVRGRPLLMLHLIDLNDGSAEKRVLVENGPAFGASFPATDDFKQIDYVLNQVMIDQLDRQAFDTPDDDEDFDS